MRLESLTIEARPARRPGDVVVRGARLDHLLPGGEGGRGRNLCGPVGADGVPPYPELSFVRCRRSPVRGQERIHLDLNSTLARPTSEATVGASLAWAPDLPRCRPARPTPRSWCWPTPEGNRFSVLDPRPEYTHLGSGGRPPSLACATTPGALPGPVGRGHRLDRVTRDDPDGVVHAPTDGGFPLEESSPILDHGPEQRQGPDPPGRGPRGRRGPGGGRYRP